MAVRLEYRQCVVGVFLNDKGEVLVGQRSDAKNAWQLPQGGVDPGESVLGAIYREMEEELGCSDFSIEKVATRAIKYAFPESVRSGVAKQYVGQSQQWYLLKFNKGCGPDLKKGDGEFNELEWRPISKVISGIVEWKRDAYTEGFEALGLQ